MAQGEGVNLEIIARYNGCEGYLKDAINLELKANFKTLFLGEDSQDKLETGINKFIEDNDQLRDVCQRQLISEA